MAPSHSLFVRKLPRGTAPHGIAHIRSSLGHLTLHEHSAPAEAAGASRANAARRPAGLRHINEEQLSQGRDVAAR
jgi:hypothetical protein